MIEIVNGFSRYNIKGIKTGILSTMFYCIHPAIFPIVNGGVREKFKDVFSEPLVTSDLTKYAEHYIELFTCFRDELGFNANFRDVDGFLESYIKHSSNNKIIHFKSIVDQMVRGQLADYNFKEEDSLYKQGFSHAEINNEKKEKANKIHKQLSNCLASKLMEKGIKPQQGDWMDLCAYINRENYIFEVKSVNNNFRNQMRNAIAKLFEYRYFNFTTKHQDARLVAVFSSKPSDKYLKYLINIGIDSIWSKQKNISQLDSNNNRLSRLLS